MTRDEANMIFSLLFVAFVLCGVVAMVFFADRDRINLEDK